MSIEKIFRQVADISSYSLIKDKNKKLCITNGDE